MDSKILQSIELIKGKERNLFRKHPWIFSGALNPLTGNFEDGSLVYINDYQKNRLGFGHYHNGSIAVKMLHFGKEDYSIEFWKHKFNVALKLRNEFSFQQHHTNCFRWVHGEGDQLPGLILDVFDKVVVIQCHTIGMHKSIQEISEAIKSILGNNLNCIIDKSKDSLPASYVSSLQNTVIFGDYDGTGFCEENGIKFIVDNLAGQKTGFFLDQRDNRKLLAEHSKNKHILNAYSYSGGFSLYALANGAIKVDSVDVSKKALDILDQNILINNLTHSNHQSICANVNDYLQTMTANEYDLIILDPPAFAKSIAKRHAAVQAYKRINLLAMKKIKSGGLLFTFSCSQVVDDNLFYHTIVSAGIESGRHIQVLKRLNQAPDHPVNLFHPEGAYLKGLVLHVI